MTMMGPTLLFSSTSRPSMPLLQLTLPLTTLTARVCLLTLRSRLIRGAISTVTSRPTCALSSSRLARVAPSTARASTSSHSLPSATTTPSHRPFLTKRRGLRPGLHRWSGWPLASPSDEASLLLSTTGGDVPTPLSGDPRCSHLRCLFCFPRPPLPPPPPPPPPRRPQLDDDLTDEIELPSDSDES